MGLFDRTPAATSGPARTVNLVKDPAGAPAINLTKVREGGHVDLAKRADKAGLALNKRGLAGIRAQVVMLLDHSGSMRADYRSGAVQTLVERALGFALQVDVDGAIPVIPFDSIVRPAVVVGVNDDAANRVFGYRGVVNGRIWEERGMGSTNLAGALTNLTRIAENTDAPVFAIVVTDGEPDDARTATQAVCKLANYPVFLKFLALRPVHYLNELDNLDDSKRLLDNVNAQPSVRGLDLLSCSDLEFADAMVDEWDLWIDRAQKAGVIR